MACLPVHWDNPRALVNGLSYAQVVTHGIPGTSRDISCQSEIQTISRAEGVDISSSAFKAEYRDL